MEILHNEDLLVVAMQAGDEAAFTILYRYYSPRLYVNILSMVRDPFSAEEMVQELFTRIWQKKESKGLQENFNGYMYRIAQNLVFDFFRSIKRDRLLQEKFRSQAGEHYEPDAYELQNMQSTAILQKAIAQLPAQQQKVYQLVKLEGHTYKMAAALMGISPLTVKEYLVAANKSVRAFFLDHAHAWLAVMITCFCKK